MTLQELLNIIEGLRIDKQNNPNYLKYQLVSLDNWKTITDVIVDKRSKTIQLSTLEK